MNVLIIGGYGFLGSHIAEKYYKEGYKIYVLDNLSSSKVKKLNVKHKLFNADISKELSEEIFKEYNFQSVIYLIKPDNNSVSCLKNSLKYASENHIKKFIYVSDISKFDKDVNLEIEESLCRIFNNVNDLKVHVLRLSKVYGEGQSIKEYESFLTDPYKDYIYVSDAVNAIYNSEKYGKSLFLNICEGKKACTYNEKKELHWDIKYNREQGIEKTKIWYEEARKNKIRLDGQNKNDSLKKIYIPFIENIVLGILFFFMNKWLHNRYGNNPIDFNFIYIIIISTTYGMKQGLYSIFLSFVSNIILNLSSGRNIMLIVHDSNMVVSLILYILIVLLLSYVLNNKNNEITALNRKLYDINQKFDFIYERYLDSRKSKKKLEEQILNSHDSLIVLYQIIRQLDYLEPELVFDSAAVVVSEIMKCREVTLYCLTSSKKYLRLLSKTRSCNRNIKHSIDLEANSSLKKAMDFDYIFVNKELNEDIPIMMCPIKVDENLVFTIGVIDIEFEGLTLYKKNLLKIVSLLIADTLKRAYTHDMSLKNEKYVHNTIILTAEYFKRIVKEKYRMQSISDNNILLLIKKYTYEELIKCVRKGDYLGMNDNGDLFLLLTNIYSEDLNKVTERLNKQKIETLVVDKSYILS